jgi:hypothetical protein
MPIDIRSDNLMVRSSRSWHDTDDGNDPATACGHERGDIVYLLVGKRQRY